MILFDVENGNPNGDPDAGNMPRIDPESGYGLVTDVCLKRKIRNYVEAVKEYSTGYEIYIKDQVPLNRSDNRALERLGVTGDLKAAKKADPRLDGKIRDFMCQNFYDIRTFGAVMTTFVTGALNCGQVRGPYPLSTNGAAVRRLMRTESSSAPRRWLWRRCWFVPSPMDTSIMGPPAAGSRWSLPRTSASGWLKLPGR